MTGYLVFLLASFGSLYFAVCVGCRIKISRALLGGMLWAVPVFCLGNALHELSHTAGFAATGVTIHEIHLVPNIFAGEFNAFVQSDELESATQALAGLPAPYFVDTLLMLFVMFSARSVVTRGNLLLSGIVLFVLVRPIVSLLLNGLQLRVMSGDFGAMAPFIGMPATVAILLGLALLELTLCTLTVIKIRKARAPDVLT